MSKYHIGDTFKIEVAEVFQGAESGNDKYRIKGFDNLVFDEKGLNRLEPIKIKTSVDDFKFGDLVLLSPLPFCDDTYHIITHRSETGDYIGIGGCSRTTTILNPDRLMPVAHIRERETIDYLNGKLEWDYFTQFFID